MEACINFRVICEKEGVCSVDVWVKIFVLFVLGVVAACARPNIVYLLADDLGYGDLSCYGQKKFKTPNIDRLALEGMKFTNHYSGNTVCTPSRAVLMTGVHSGKCYIRGNVWDEKLAAIPEELATLPEVLKKAGYRTGAFGKWGLGVTNGSQLERPSGQGFDEFVGWKSQVIAHTYYPTSYVRNGEEVMLEKGTFVNPIINQAALDFMRKSVEAKKPFFCYIPTAIPHAAMHAPKELHEKWRKVFPEHDEKIGRYGAGPGEETPDVVNPIAGFAAMMEHLDNHVGEILALLEELGVDENTVVMFASDNGAHREGGHDPKFWDSTGGLRGMKRDMHEGGIRTPMLVRWPGRIKKGAVTNHLSGFHDILPTVSELVGEKVPEQNTGISFMPTLFGQGDQKKHEYLLVEFHQGGRRGGPVPKERMHSQALRFGPWKIFHRKGQELELFHLEDDPFEERDLAKDPKFQEILTQGKRYLEEGSQPL